MQTKQKEVGKMNKVAEVITGLLTDAKNVTDSISEGSCQRYESGICSITGKHCNRNGIPVMPYTGPCNPIWKCHGDKPIYKTTGEDAK